MITEFNKYNINESVTLSGKHSFLMFLQVISNHDYHFITNDNYTELYNYHFFFSTETIKGVDDYIEIFKYKKSLVSSYETLKNIKSNKLAFFFGVKDEGILRYGFLDIDTRRSYVTGEFKITGGYFRSIAKYKAMSFINKVIQNVSVKSLPTLSKIKKDFKDFYKSKKSEKIKVINNKVIKFVSKKEFTEEDFTMNRPYRDLDSWISKKSWRNKVEYSVDDTTDPVQFIIIVK